MKKTTKYIMTAAAVILIIAAVILAVKVRGNASKDSGLVINNGEKTAVISWDDLNQTVFTGELVNGKGETFSHEYKGVELLQLLSDSGIEITAETAITAASEDNYTVELTGAEVLTSAKVYVAVMCDSEMIEGIDGGQGAQLVVYGDPNAKRQVRYLKTITVK